MTGIGERDSAYSWEVECWEGNSQILSMITFVQKTPKEQNKYLLGWKKITVHSWEHFRPHMGTNLPLKKYHMAR